MVRRYDETGLMEEAREGFYVLYTDYAALEAENARLHEALRECVHQIQCVRDYYPIHPIDDPKLVYTLRQAAEALVDEKEGGAE